jgi:hypothetical protein
VPLVSPLASDILSVKQDVSKTIWAVEEYIIASRQQQKIQDHKLQKLLATSKKRVSFAPVLQVGTPLRERTNIVSDTPSSMEKKQLVVDTTRTIITSPTETVATTPTESELKDENNASIVSNDDDYEDDEELTLGTFSPLSHATGMTNDSFSLCSRVVRWRKASANEMKILYNVLLSVLRSEPQDSDYFEDDRYYVRQYDDESLLPLFLL